MKHHYTASINVCTPDTMLNYHPSTIIQFYKLCFNCYDFVYCMFISGYTIFVVTILICSVCSY